MTYFCHVCAAVIDPATEPRGKVRLEGVAVGESRAWVWGPVTVHEECRLRLVTPLDDQVSAGEAWFMWQRMSP